MEFTIPTDDGVYLIPFSSRASDRTISIRYHTMPTGGTVDILARPIGRTDFIAIDGVDPFSAEGERTISCAYPLAELKVTLSGMAGGTVAIITIADAE
jgi:hypothetical protein